MIREVRLLDHVQLFDLYREVARIPGGLACQEHEITFEYVRRFLHRAMASGVSLVKCERGRIVGEIHAYRPGPRCFDHVLGELTLAVAPGHQGQGIGRELFDAFLDVVAEIDPPILRIELLARRSNQRAIALYEQLGFRREGELRARARTLDGDLESDVVMAWHPVAGAMTAGEPA